VSPEQRPGCRAPAPVVVGLRGPLAAEQADRLAERWRSLVERSDARLVCELHDPVDLGVLSVLARLVLAARRSGAQLRLRGRAEVLAGLGTVLELTGLSGPLRLGLEPLGQAEAGEQPGVQEVVDVGDPPA